MERSGMLVAVDLDNVIVETDSQIRDIIARISGIALSRDDIVEFAYSKALMAKGLGQLEAERVVESALTIFHEAECGGLDLVPGALEGLEGLKGRGLSVVIVTSRPPSAEILTREGLARTLISPRELLFLADTADFVLLDP